MTKRILFLILLPTLSCTHVKQIEFKNRKYEELIIGKWQLTKPQFDYPLISFEKQHIAWFSSTGDTIYSYGYRLYRDTLFLKNGNNKEIKNKIIKLTSDSLIFLNLLDFTDKQAYIRDNN